MQPYSIINLTFQQLKYYDFQKILSKKQFKYKAPIYSKKGYLILPKKYLKKNAEKTSNHSTTEQCLNFIFPLKDHSVGFNEVLELSLCILALKPQYLALYIFPSKTTCKMLKIK